MLVEAESELQWQRGIFVTLEAVMGECTALVRLAHTVSGMQSSRCGHGWRIARAAAVYLAAVLLAEANITKQPPRSWGRGL